MFSFGGTLNTIDHIKRIIAELTNEEIRSLVKLLTAKTKASKSAKFLALIQSQPNDTDETLKAKVGLSIKSSAYSTFISDFRDKIIEAVCLDHNISRRSFYSDYERTNYWVRKRMMASEILLGRGLKNEARYLYDKIINKCIDYEIYDVLIECLILKRNITAIHERQSAILEIQAKIDFYIKTKTAYEEARFVFSRLNSATSFHANPIETKTFINDTVERLEHDLLQFNSKNLYYYLCFLKVYILETEGKIEDAITLLRELRQNVIHHPSLNRRIKLSPIELNLAHYYLKVGETSFALHHSELGVQIARPKSFNYFMALEQQFVAQFHAGEIGKSHVTIRSLVAKSPPEDTFYKAKRYYYRACVLLLQRHHKYAHDCLQFTKALDADKNGWNIAVRILDIMNQIEWNGLRHSADPHIDNLRDHIFKTRKIKPITPRNLAILDILKALVKEGFNFDTVAAQKASVLQKLSSGNEDYEWNMTSPELIRFDAWFMASVKKVEYRYDLALST